MLNCSEEKANLLGKSPIKQFRSWNKAISLIFFLLWDITSRFPQVSPSYPIVCGSFPWLGLLFSCGSKTSMFPLKWQLLFQGQRTEPMFSCLLGLCLSLVESDKWTGSHPPCLHSHLCPGSLGCIICLPGTCAEKWKRWMAVKFSSLPWHLPRFLYSVHTPASYLVFAVSKEVKQSRRSFKANCPVFPGWSASVFTSFSIPPIMLMLLWTSIIVFAGDHHSFKFFYK